MTTATLSPPRNRAKKTKSEGITGIRDYGDNKTIVVYTTSNQVAQKLKERSKLINTVDYLKDFGNDIRVVARDFYFPKRQLRSILRSLGCPQSKDFKLDKFAEIKILVG